MKPTNQLRRDIGGWVLMLPSLALFAFFIWEPLIECVRLSLHSAKGYKIVDFVGLANYKSLFINPDFGTAWANTGQYIIWSLIIGFFVPMFIAVMITEAPFFKGITRVLVYLPNIIPGLAVALIWLFFYKSGDHGVLNTILGWFGQPPFDWLTAKGWTIPLIVVIMTWKSAGATALIYMAGIAGINPEIIEAATIDGATPFKRFLHVTLPDLLGLAKTMFILQIISVFQILYEPLMLNGTYTSKVSVMMIVYSYAFDQFDYPKAAAASVMICIALAILTVFYFAMTRKVGEDK
ncbi:ABC transporter [Clostridia bacterium]|nr:ABC transporter [Clostridia bacterium]